MFILPPNIFCDDTAFYLAYVNYGDTERGLNYTPI